MQSRTYTITHTELKRSTDLMYYLMTNNLDKIKQLNLINRGNVNNIIDKINKSTALHYSLQLQDNSITNYLLELGADPYIKNASNKDSFELSLDYHKKYVFDFVIKTKETKICNLDDECVQLRKKIKLETESKEYLSKSVDNYRSTMKNLQNDIKNINDKNDILQNDNNDLKDQNRSLKRKIEKLNDSIDGFLNSNKK